SENKLAYKNIDSTIDQTLIASTAQKSLGMQLQKEGEDGQYTKMKLKKKKENKEESNEQVSKKETIHIERNPLILLRLF
nr:hypothetical protein [Bacteriovorax sp.]